MSTVTPNLGLFKYDILADANAAFNINTALNNNWDKIDEAISNSGGARNIGEIVASTIPLTDAGLHLLDGALIQGSGIYSDFVNYIAGLYDDTDTPNYFTDENTWQQSITDYGVCGKFVYDSVNNSVRLPKITGIVEGTTDVTALGDLVEAGLPNITGSINGILDGQFGSGALYRTIHYENWGANGANGSYYNFEINASRSSSIYGNSTTVQPQSIKILYYIVIATSTKTEIEVDIDEIATDLNGKADVDLSNISASQSAKDEIILWGTPDYANGITFTSGFTAPSIGWISINGWSQTAGTNTNVYINDVVVSTMASGGGQVSNATQLPVNKGDVIVGNYSYTMLFFPMKGAN